MPFFLLPVAYCDFLTCNTLAHEHVLVHVRSSLAVRSKSDVILAQTGMYGHLQYQHMPVQGYVTILLEVAKQLHVLKKINLLEVDKVITTTVASSYIHFVHY